MSFFEPQGWQAPARQTSWEQPAPPSRSEVDKAIDNLVKSGKFYPAAVRPMGAGRGGHRMHGSRHSLGDFDPSRQPPGANLQNFYATQRHQGRHNEGDPMMHAKRRIAAQRERELRNYHQEQQYNRSVLAEMSSNRSEHSMSPSTLSEEGRRDLLLRQQRALYSADGGSFAGPGPFAADEGKVDQVGALAASGGTGPRGASPRAVDPFGPSDGQPPTAAPEGARPEKSASPSAVAGSGFASFESPTQTAGAGPTTPPGDESSHSRQMSKSTTAPVTGAMGPIGSRPSAAPVSSQALNKRTTSPLPASLGYGYAGNEPGADRSGSANSNPAGQKESSAGNGGGGMGSWGTGSGVWGNNKIGTTSVWG